MSLASFSRCFRHFVRKFPDVLSLGSEASAKLISSNAACAFRAFSRIEASESAVGTTSSSLLRDQDRPLRHFHHVLASISEDAAHDLVTEAITESDEPAHPATWPCTYPIVVNPPLLPWSKPAQSPHY